jgi:hypothetical protein
MMQKIFVLVLLFLLLNSCKRKWTDKDKQEFLSGCINSATKELGSEKAKQYCHCMLDKVLVRYPDAGDINWMSRDTAMPRMGRDCLKQP